MATCHAHGLFVLAVIIPFVVSMWNPDCYVKPDSRCMCRRGPDILRVYCANLGIHTISTFRKIASGETISLDLSGNNINRLEAQTFGQNVLIQELVLSYNLIDGQMFFSIDIFTEDQADRMSSLVLTHDRLTYIPEFVNKLRNLLGLDLSHNRIDNIPAGSFDGLSNLEVLDLTGNPLRHVDSQVLSNVENLKVLRVTIDEQTIEMQEDIRYVLGNSQAVDNLKELSIEDTRLMSVAFLRSSDSLHILRLKGCSLDSSLLAEQGSQLRKKSKRTLNQADLSHNQLTVYPTELLAGCRKLEYLDLSHNKIVDVEIPVVLVALTYLDLSHNNIRFYPVVPKLQTFFSRCIALEHLDLSHNRLGDLNVELIDIASRLEYMDLSNNLISYIGAKFIESFASLRHFDLSGNQLVTLEVSSVEHLPHLQLLNVSNNRIVSIPPVGGLSLPPKLSMGFSGNPLACDCRGAALSYTLYHQAIAMSGPFDWSDVYNLECTRHGERLTVLENYWNIHECPGWQHIPR